jgi:hypothetical protein
MSHSSPKIPAGFSPSHWASDLFAFQKLAGAASPQECHQLMDDFLYQKYPDDPDARWKGVRLLAAHLWLLQHFRELDVSQVGIVGSSVFSITSHTAVALYRVFAAMPDDRLHQDVDASLVITLAQEQARINESST